MMEDSGKERSGITAAGIDIGAATTKAVILSSDEIIASSIIPTGYSVIKAGETVMEKVLAMAGLKFENLYYIVSTGYGRRAVSFANQAVTEIICHARGVNAVLPQARTIIDIGGQDSKVIESDETGSVINFVMNDKCAAGTGRFLEVMARVLDVNIEEMGSISLHGEKPCRMGSTCTVFAESEMISLRAEGASRENMLAGIHKALAHRVAVMGSPLGFKKGIAFTGGVAKNTGIKKALEDEISSTILVPEEPQLAGALGAAILAKSKLASPSKS
jgi:predicted CoA-substrate-specific enzyme activase